MKESNYLTISEFSKISEVSRKSLIFYDNIGLFSPKVVGENGYRYYSHEQIYIISVIIILKEMGTPLSQIKEYMKNGNPADAIRILRQQGESIAHMIEKMQGVQDMLHVKLQMLMCGSQSSVSDIQILEQPKQPIFTGDPVHMAKSGYRDENWLAFYMKCKENKVTFGYPEGFMVNREDLLAGNTGVGECVICHVGKPEFANAFMPAGRYLTACGTGSFYDTEPTYQRMLQYIRSNHLEILGNAYEKRLIDEIGSNEKGEQMMQVQIQIR